MSKFFTVNLLANKTAEILLYGYIGDDIIASDFLKELKNLEKTNTLINVRINSAGGSIFEGLGIYNAIKNCTVPVDGYIDGIAASMASAIAAGCRKVYMSKASMFMTHRASGVAAGDASKLRNYAQMMESLEDLIATIYAQKTGLTKEEAKSKYIKGGDRWLTAEEALAEKIIDGIYEATGCTTAPANITDVQELVGYFNAQMNYKNLKQDKMLKFNLTTSQLTKLKVDNSADEATVQAAIDTLIAQADKVPQLITDLNVANVAKKTAEDALATLKSATTSNEVANILETALDAKKMTVETKNQLAKDYATNPTGLKTLVAAMPAITGVVAQLNNEDAGLKALVAMSWDELDKSGKAGILKEKNLEAFKAKFKEQFGSEYKG